MLNKIFLITFLLISCISTSQDLMRIRTQYPKAQKSEELTIELDKALDQVSSNSDPVLIAYKGAVKTLMADFAKKVKDKKDYFKQGVELLESSLNSEPQNIEIRYLRLSIQEHAPKFLKYHDNITEDKAIILINYSSISPKSLKTIIKEYILTSENFDEAEKNSLD